MTTRELVLLADEHGGDEAGNAASAELASRSREAICKDLQALLADQSFRARGEAARLLGAHLDPSACSRSEDLDPATSLRAEHLLIAMLKDSDLAVRLGALESLARLWWLRRPHQVPEAVAAVLLEGLRSTDTSIRARAAYAARQVGPAISALHPFLLEALRRETPDGPRALLALAVESVGPGLPETEVALVEVLGDPDDKLRYFAIWGLTDLSSIAAETLAHLFSCIEEGEPEDVRTMALGALAKHVETPSDIERTLSGFLDARGLYSTPDIHRWLGAVGKLAARIPDSPVTAAVAEMLQHERSSDDHHHRLAAVAALARVACARRDQALVADLLPELSTSLDDLAEPAPPDQWDAEFSGLSFDAVLETLVELARSEQPGVDRAGIRAVLERCRSHQYWWIREWAAKQLLRIE